MSEFEGEQPTGELWSDAIVGQQATQPVATPAVPPPSQSQEQQQKTEDATPATTASTTTATTASSSSPQPSTSSTTDQQQPTAEGDADPDKLAEAIKSKALLTSAFKGFTKKFAEAQAEMHVQQADPSNPLYAALEFDDVGKQPNTLPIKPAVLKAASAMNYKKPSKIQSTALPLLLKNPPENLIFQSQPGTGKTAAFTMNVLTRIDETKQFPQALYVAPTFQLCYQTSQVIEALAQHTNIQVGLLFGSRDQDSSQQVGNVADLRGKAPHQVLCCTLKKLISEARTRRKFDPRSARIVVVDEADAMLENRENFDLLKQLRTMLASNAQIILLSATFPPHVMKLAHQVAPNANIITIPVEEVTVKEDIKQLYVECNGYRGKQDALLAIYENLDVKQAIIFCNRKSTVEDLARLLTEEGMSVCTISSNQSKADQLLQLDRFLQGLDNVLIATDMLSRGIDIPQISIVVNFDVPLRISEKGEVLGPGFETYAHRVGRLGCFRGGGAAITLVQNHQELDTLLAIAAHYKTDIVQIRAEEQDLKDATSDLV